MNKDLFKNRYQVIRIIIVSFAVIFLIRLFYLQVINRSYVALAKNNAIKELDVAAKDHFFAEFRERGGVIR